MTVNPDAAAEIERRLRRLCGALDATAAFAPALQARIDSLRSAEDEATRRERRVRAYRERLQAESQLRRRFWQTVAATLLIAVAAAFLAWLADAPIGRALIALGSSHDMRNPLAIGSLALLLGWVWLAVRGAGAGSWRRLAFG